MYVFFFCMVLDFFIYVHVLEKLIILLFSIIKLFIYLFKYSIFIYLYIYILLYTFIYYIYTVLLYRYHTYINYYRNFTIYKQKCAKYCISAANMNYIQKYWGPRNIYSYDIEAAYYFAFVHNTYLYF